jgi:acetoin utilization deacetylase AcuC-like enzyme
MTTGLFWSERTFWHSGGIYAGILPVGGLVQPTGGGLPENPETKRRLINLINVPGLAHDLEMHAAAEASTADLLRVHPQSYLDAFKTLSDAGGGELGRRTPFGPGGYDIAALSAGLSIAALDAVLRGQCRNAYALSRPPGHHCLPDYPNGFCLFANLAIAIQAARAAGLAERFVVLEWDVHHGNGTEAIFYSDPNVFTLSIHQDRNYPMDTGAFNDRGEGAGEGANLNIPLPPGAGHATYIEAMERLALPAIRAFNPDVIIIASGYDAAVIDPLSAMLATADTFRIMTQQVRDLADDICDGRLMMAHEGGYSEVYVPFCGHAVLQEMARSSIDAPDPMAETFEARQPGDRYRQFASDWISDMVDAL